MERIVDLTQMELQLIPISLVGLSRVDDMYLYKGKIVPKWKGFISIEDFENIQLNLTEDMSECMISREAIVQLEKVSGEDLIKVREIHIKSYTGNSLVKKRRKTR